MTDEPDGEELAELDAALDGGVANPDHLVFDDERSMVLYLDDLRRFLCYLGYLAGTVDLFGASVPLDLAEEQGLDVGPARAAIASLVSIRAALGDWGVWPAEAPMTGPFVFEAELEEAIRLVNRPYSRKSRRLIEIIQRLRLIIAGRWPAGSETSSITCPRCGLTSHHPQDVRRRYCGHCHRSHDDAAGSA